MLLTVTISIPVSSDSPMATMMHRPSSAKPPRLSLAAAVLAAGQLVACVGCARPAAPAAVGPPAAAEVTVTKPQPVRVPEYLEVTGRIDAELLVDVRSRITGYLTKVAFRDGQFVTKGDPLYEIDVRPYAAQLAAATGTVEQLVGQRRFLEVQVDRYGKLVAKGAASQQEFDSYKARLEENTGSLAAARAQAKAENTTLNEQFRLWLAAYARKQHMQRYEQVMAGLRGKVVVGRKLTRDEMNER